MSISIDTLRAVAQHHQEIANDLHRAADKIMSHIGYCEAHPSMQSKFDEPWEAVKGRNIANVDGLRLHAINAQAFADAVTAAIAALSPEVVS